LYSVFKIPEPESVDAKVMFVTEVIQVLPPETYCGVPIDKEVIGGVLSSFTDKDL
jgi:hypothetical protein